MQRIEDPGALIGYAGVWGLANPATGSGTISLESNIQSEGGMVIGALGLSGVDTSATPVTSEDGGSSRTSLSGDFTGLTGDAFILDASYFNASGTPTFGSGQTELYNVNTGKGGDTFGSYEAFDAADDPVQTVSRSGGGAKRASYAGAGFTAIPEPASLAMLGLGTLAMLPRRKRVA